MTIEEFKVKVFDELNKKNHMVLGTSANNRVTTRNVSTIFMDGKIYFQTDKKFLKILQIIQNPNVSLCELDMQVEGVAKILGHPLEDENKEFLKAFSQKHQGSFEEYSYLPNEVVVEITPKLIEMWAYENDRPIIYNLNLEANKYSRNDYPMNHNMHLDGEPFEMVKSGVKKFEYRLNDEKRQLIKVGDIITFYKRPEETELVAMVEELRYFKDLLSMYSNTFEEDIKSRYGDKYRTPQDVVNDTPYYSNEEIEKYGCVAIKIGLIKSFLQELKEILEQNKNKRIVVVGTTCTGKSTLLKSIENGLDMDEVIFPLLTQEENDIVCATPWTEKIGKYMNKLVKEKIKIEPCKPIFGTVVIDSDLIIYLDISDSLLLERTLKRNVSFDDAYNMNMKIKEEVENSNIPYIKLRVR